MSLAGYAPRRTVCLPTDRWGSNHGNGCDDDESAWEGGEDSRDCRLWHRRHAELKTPRSFTPD